MKSVQIGSFFYPNTGKYGPERTPCLDAFHAVLWNSCSKPEYVRLLQNTAFGKLGKSLTVKHLNLVNEKFAMPCWYKMLSGKLCSEI